MPKAIQNKTRMLDIFYRAMRGEAISVQKMSEEYNVSTKSIQRDINEIKNFLSEGRDLVGHAELIYSMATRTYHLELEHFLLSKELIGILKVLIGAKAFSKDALSIILTKLKGFTSANDRKILTSLLAKELYKYTPVKHDCEDVITLLWDLSRYINEYKEISISYYKVNRELVKRRVQPLAIIFSEYYFYLIASRTDLENVAPVYYRVDRIVDVVEHKEKFKKDEHHNFDEGELRKKIQLMYGGLNRKIKFEFEGDSVQAMLDKFPTARIIKSEGNSYTIEADTLGKGIKMVLLSQGSFVKVLEPPELVEEIKAELEKMTSYYK